MLDLSFDYQALINDARYMHYSWIEKRIFLKDDIFCRQYYNGVGDTSYLQVSMPVQLLATFLKSSIVQQANILAYPKSCRKYEVNTTFHQLPNTYENGYNNVKHALKTSESIT